MMEYGVCNLSAIPLRAETSEKAEMVSQLLFGDAFLITEQNDEWLKIKTCDCDYEGWINKKLFNSLHHKDVENYLMSEKYIVKDYLFFLKDFETNITFPIFIGSSFPYPQGDMLILGDRIFIVNLPEDMPKKKHPVLSVAQHSLLSFVSVYLESPYLWGGRTPAGIDCSGLVQLAFKSIGISIPRDASQQVHCGNFIDINETQPGDVAFFHNEGGKIVHTGIVLSSGQIIHASGKVRIDRLDATGILNEKSGEYTHKLHVIKRIIS